MGAAADPGAVIRAPPAARRPLAGGMTLTPPTAAAGLAVGGGLVMRAPPVLLAPLMLRPLSEGAPVGWLRRGLAVPRLP